MKSILGIFCLLTFLGISRAQEPEPEAISEANRLYAEGSYRKAWEIYNSITLGSLPPDRQRWIQFRTADSLWRSETASEKADQTATEPAIRTLRELAKEGLPRDPTGAAIEESLGDYQWQGKRWPDWSDAWPHYRKALEYWAGSTNLAPAAEHYLGIVWKAAKPNQVPHAFNSLHGHNLPAQILENALRIARTEEERAHAHYLLALALSRDGTDWAKLRRVPNHFRQAIELERDTPWYDDALFHFAESMEQKGRVVRDSHLNWVFQPDYPKAVELYRKLLSDFKKGESPYYEQAQRQLANIIGPVVNASVSYTFEPGTEVYFDLHWRNVESIEMNLYRVDLAHDIRLARERRTDDEWLASIDLRQAEKVRSWSHDPKDNGEHQPGQETIRLEESPGPGAYVLEVSGGAVTEREIIMITDIALLLKSTPGKTLVWLCEAGSGVPIAHADVSLWLHHHDGNSWFWTRAEGKTDEQGIAVFPDKSGGMQQRGAVAAASIQGRQAFARVQSYHPAQREERWQIYAATDRPAYRPDEVVHWKATARVHDGQVYTTPARRDLKMTVLDPRGAEIFQKTLKLNSFGSAWGEIPVTSGMPLGVYDVVYSDPSGRQLGRNSLFRLEEYKLPEFKVTVSTPEDEHGRRKTFLAGEAVEAEILAEYYFGGPVANATVEVVVRQRPYYRIWREDHEFPWFYQDSRRGGSWGGQVIQRESLTTDAFGQATVKIQSPSNADENLEFIIEARVTDASRREISAQDAVRVTLQRYQVQAKPEHYLHRPGNKVEVRFTALDANDYPVAAEGTVQVIRDTWVEVWVDPQGREVTGPALAEARRRNPRLPGWEARFQGYEHEHILTRTLKTGTNGLAALAFTPAQEGYYRVTWLSEADPDLQAEVVGRPVKAQTAVWVADHQSRHIGYHTGGVQIIIDRDTFRAGETAPVMIVAEGNDHHVLLTVEGEELISQQMWHLAGSVKLVQLPIGEEHIPNVRLNVALFSDFQLQVDSEEVVVPPVRNFLTLELEPGQEAYRPGEEGRFTLSVKDHAGKPVRAEVALSVADESVFYIQDDLAGDPRQFFFGQRNDYRVSTDSSFGFRQYLSKLREQELAREQEALREEVRRTSGLAEGVPAPASRTYFFRDRALTRSVAATPARAEAKLGADVALAYSIAPAMMDAAAPPAQDAEGSAVQVRSDFRTTIFWEPAVQTDDKGKAEVTVRYPDSLTGWKATARAVTTGNQFGIAHAATRTTQPLMIRLQAPRFFQVGDSVTVSAILNNNTGEPLEVRPAIQIEGMAAPENATPAAVTVPAQGEQRVDWVVHPSKAGEAKITVIARAEGHSDAMARTYPIQEHGIEKFLAVSGKVRGDAVTVQLDLPAERKPETTLMTVQVTPSLAVTMLDALPYLVHYPYGCTEQTMSRFLPAVITARTLEKLGLHPEDVMGHAFGGIEEESAAATHPDGQRNLEELDEIVRAGLQRLYDFQHQDGGWGWWKEGDSDPFMTSYVLWGLVLAREAEVEVREAVIAQAANFLNVQLVEATHQHDLQAWMLHALAVHHARQESTAVAPFQRTAFDNLWENRDRLNAYTRALLALSAHHYGFNDRAEVLVRNLENGVIRDEDPSSSVLVASGPASAGQMGTAHWGEDGIYWRWSDGGVEATAFALKALLVIDPENELVEPVTNWLIKNRRGAQWSNTRDTAICLLTLNDYLRQSGELETELDFAVQVNGTIIAEKSISKSDLFSAPSRFEVPREHLRNGRNEIVIKRTSGSGPLYFSAAAEFFSLEEPVPAVGHEIFVKREYYRLTPQPTLLQGHILTREKMQDGDRIASGERVEVVVTVEAKNNYEYLVFEDLKPAGLEAVEIQSGSPLYARELNIRGIAAKHGPGDDQAEPAAEPLVQQRQERQGQTSRRRYVYQELRDRKVALFLDKLPQGVWEMRYELRAEVPGEFHALPVLGHAMYVPEIRCNSTEMHLEVTERAQPKPAT